jgi:DNA polymerase-3 subunit epsilon
VESTSRWRVDGSYLSAAARFYLGREHEEAHTALGDIRTSAAVLGAQLARYPGVPRDLDGLHAYCEEFAPTRTEVDRWFSPEEEGRVFRRGKHKGTPLAEVARNTPDYLQWMLGADDMDEAVLDIVRDALGTPGGTDEADGTKREADLKHTDDTTHPNEVAPERSTSP